MANILDGNGLEVNSLNEIIDNLTVGFAGIYGADINVSQNSPDGQAINIQAQSASDILGLLVKIYNSFTVANAFGTYLDQRVAMNGMVRNAGTYTVTNVTVVVSQALNLTGLDALTSDPTATVFTVSDGNGNNFLLEETQTIGAAGTYVYSFRAENVGKIETTLNTITNQTTTVLGVTSVNNPTSATTTGTDEESDADLKIRFGRSFYLGARSAADSTYANLLQLDGVSDALVFVNNTASEDGFGVPAHAIWCIVEGGEDADIANAIYATKPPGTDMKGDETYEVVRPAGNTITIKYDRPQEQDLYIRFTITPRSTGELFDPDQIKSDIVENITYNMNQVAAIGDFISYMATAYPNAILTDNGVSENGSDYTDTQEPDTPKNKFVLDVARIVITVP